MGELEGGKVEFVEKERVTAVLTKSSKGAIVRVKYWTPSQRQLKEYKRIHPEDPDGCDNCMLACTNVQSVQCTYQVEKEAHQHLCPQEWKV